MFRPVLNERLRIKLIANYGAKTGKIIDARVDFVQSIGFMLEDTPLLFNEEGVCWKRLNLSMENK